MTSTKVPVQHHYSSDTGDPTKWSKGPCQLWKKKIKSLPTLFFQIQGSNHGGTELVGRRTVLQGGADLLENSPWFGKCLQMPNKGVNPSEIQLLLRKWRLHWVSDIRMSEIVFGWNDIHVSDQQILKTQHKVSCCNRHLPPLALTSTWCSSASMHIQLHTLPHSSVLNLKFWIPVSPHMQNLWSYKLEIYICFG